MLVYNAEVINISSVAFANICPPYRVPLSKRIRASLSPALHENIYNVPNILTFSRLVAAPVVGYLIAQDQQLAALSLFVYAAVTDLVDGWIARKWKLQTVVGTVIDPMADKTLMTVVTVALAMKGALPGMRGLGDHHQGLLH